MMRFIDYLGIAVSVAYTIAAVLLTIGAIQ